MMAAHDAADAALDAALGSMPTADPDAYVRDDDSNHTRHDSDNESGAEGWATPDTADSSEPGAALDVALAAPPQGEVVEGPSGPCTEGEARRLVADLRSSLERFDLTLSEIVRRRAWEALGYDTPAAFVIGELGPDKNNPDAPGRVGRTQSYRLARMAMFMYGLSERVGDSAYSIQASERILRGLPAGEDETLLNRVESALADLGEDDVDETTIKSVLDDQIDKARGEYQEKGYLSDEDPPRGNGALDDDWSVDNPDGEPGAKGTGSRRRDSNGDWEDLDEVEVDDDNWSADAAHVGDTDRKDLIVGGEDDGDDDDEPRRTSSMDSSAYLEGFNRGDVTKEALAASEALRGILGAFEALATLADFLPQILDCASDDELADLIEHANTADQLVQDTIAAAEDRL